MKTAPVKFETAVYGDCQYYVRPSASKTELKPAASGNGS
jgi:hypothetical protein